MSFFKDKVILVTGAGGSIGSELCRSLAGMDLKTLILFDSSELALYNIERKLRAPNVRAVLGDVSDNWDVRAVFGAHDIDIVFHAAAYKHVTLCEKNAHAAWRVNSVGTRVVVDAAAQYDVPRLVLVSTDKAVRPTCVMGVTKQRAEEIVRKANYTTVRLGNVYGSSGSVIPLWQEQIAAGEPVTITHPGATRCFISGQDAAYVLMRAAELLVGGETFVPKLTPKSIVDIARDLGAKDFKYIGLAPGEKLHEELFVGVPVETPEWGLMKDAA